MQTNYYKGYRAGRYDKINGLARFFSAATVKNPAYISGYKRGYNRG